MKNFNTPREIRQVLFQLPTSEADSVRHELFDVVNQDSAAPAALLLKALKAVRDYENSK